MRGEGRAVWHNQSIIHSGCWGRGVGIGGEDAEDGVLAFLVVVVCRRRGAAAVWRADDAAAASAAARSQQLAAEAPAHVGMGGDDELDE